MYRAMSACGASSWDEALADVVLTIPLACRTVQDGTEKAQKVFVSVPTEVGQTEAEEIGALGWWQQVWWQHCVWFWSGLSCYPLAPYTHTAANVLAVKGTPDLL